MRRRFGTGYLRGEFERLGAALEHPTNVNLIGGGSMSFRDLKATTPIESFLAEETDRIYRELEVLVAVEDRTTISDLSNKLDWQEADVIKLLDNLEAKGVIQRDGAEVRKIGERP